jgi:hypothetical protein
VILDIFKKVNSKSHFFKSRKIINMGTVISTVIGVFALFSVGVLSSIAATKNKDCDGRKYDIISASIGFIAAVIMMIMAIFLL